MKSLLLKAVAAAFIVGTFASCTSMSGASNTSPKLLTKAQAIQYSTNQSRTSTSAHSWSSSSAGNFLPASVGVAVKSSAAALPRDKHGRPTYHSESARHRFVRTTSYSHQEGEVGAPGRLNAIGTTLKYGRVRSAAADWSRYPVGTIFKIKGLPYTYVVDDYGSALVGTNTIDIYHPTLGLMRQWATRDVEINIIRWGSWERTANLLKGRTKYAHCAQMYYAALRKLNSARVAQTTSNANPAL